MAAVATTETVNVTINDVELAVPKGELVVEAVKRLGLEIPVFCYHPRMKPVGMCRMCLVEVGFKQPDGSVRKMPKPQAGCTLPVSEGMVIYTETEAVHRDRKGVLEFLLINHPLDCPICDRGGECPLQNNTLAYGPSTSRFVEMKRHLPKAYPLSEYVTLDLERCIQCGRCVRFTEEISGDSQLAFRFRGASMQPSTFQLTNFESKFSGNVIEICPVGALTSARYRFRARPWDIEAQPGICTETPCGTNVWIDRRDGKLVRINGRSNEEVNEEWTCDKTKFGHDHYRSEDRIKVVNVREGNGFVGATWSKAYQLLVEKFAGAGNSAAVILSSKLSNESLFVAKNVIQNVIKSSAYDFRTEGHLISAKDNIEHKYGVSTVQRSLADLEHAKGILVFGTALADDQPMTFLRVRKAWFKHGAKISVAHTATDEVAQFANQVTSISEGKLAQAAAALAAAAGVAGAPAGGNDPAMQSAIEAIKAGGAIVATTALYETADGARAAEILAAVASTIGASFSLLHQTANGVGATEIGCTGEHNTVQILEGCRSGSIKSLWLVGEDPLGAVRDQNLVREALEAVEFLVVQDAMPTERTSYASLVLPLALPAEQIGSYTSSERRVQSMDAPLTAPGEAKAAWQVMNDFAVRAGANPSDLPLTISAVRSEMTTKVEAFEGLDWEAVANGGQRLKASTQAGDWGALAATFSAI